MNSLHWFVLLIILTLSEASAIIYLENCTYTIDLYQEYLNLLWSSNDSRTIDIQAVYSLVSNHSFTPGHIYTSLSQSVALIPFFVRCKYPANLSSRSYLPFTQCSSTIINFSTRKNYEPTRTYLSPKSVLSMNNVPLLYTGEYNLLLANCSFEYRSHLYQLRSNDVFTFRIQYEKAINKNITSCQQCNQRTSICHKNKCRCRSGTIPLKLSENKDFCIDMTSNCSYDSQRCLSARSTNTFNNHSNQFLLIFILLITLLFISFLFLLWCVFRKTSKQIVFQKEDDLSSNPSIFTIDRHERTPSTISTTDSVKLSDYNHLDQHILANEYVSTFYDEYPRVMTDKNNADVILILA